MLTICTALTTFGVCGAVRWYLRRRPAYTRSGCREAEYLQGRVRLRALWNPGAAFSLPIPAKTLPLASAAALVLLWTRRSRSPLGTGLILGGGLSNLRERVWDGRVYDYIQFPKAPGSLKRCVFNLADMAVFTGGLSLLIRDARTRGQGRRGSVRRRGK